MKRKPKPYSSEDLSKLRAYSKAMTPTVKVAKLMNRSVGSLQQKCIRLGIPLGHRPHQKMTSQKIKEQTCPFCNGLGFPMVKQPTRPDQKLYPARCKICDGRGKIREAGSEAMRQVRHENLP